MRRKMLAALAAVMLLTAGPGAAVAKAPTTRGGGPMAQGHMTTNAERTAAAIKQARARKKAGGKAAAAVPGTNTKLAAPSAGAGGPHAPTGATTLTTPDYFGTVPNYANSPLPTSVSIQGDGTGAFATATVSAGAIGSITVTSPGSGYTDAATSVVVIGGGGSGATGQATIVNGAVAGISILATGSGYSATPTVTVSDTPPGTGSGAIATAAVSGGAITGITLTAFGSGYSDPVVTITDSTGSGAVASATTADGAITSIAVTAAGSGYDTVSGIRKFVDALPLPNGTPNENGQYLPVAVPDTTTFSGSTGNPAADYYEIAVVQYTQKMHSDLPATTLRGYVQIWTPALGVPQGPQLFYPDGSPILDGTGNPVYGVAAPQYLGPVISATTNRPVRVKFDNYLPTGTGGDLFLPVDNTVMGAGMGPNGGTYSQNRADIHLHGGVTPWISDGTPDQWTTPVNATEQYPKGVSTGYVPDMWYDANGDDIPSCDGQPTCSVAGASTNPGPGRMTFYYTNQQSARLMFYHDHVYGITRLDVYAGEAAAYLVGDDAEAALVNGGTIGGTSVAAGTLPADQIPLVIEDKTFVPSDAQLAAEDPTWSTAAYGGYGNLWFPHVYMPNQNPGQSSGANPMGRWDYGPWFWPLFTQITNGELPNPYACGGALAGPNCAQEPSVIPGTPNPSIVPEGFMDTMTVNGTAYPYVQLGQKQYRFRILNASNDRTLNLSLYYAGTETGGRFVPCMGATWNGNTLNANGCSGEVPMVPATKGGAGTSGYTYPDQLDGRVGGVPDSRAKGPSMVQVGTEGGFLAQPATIPNGPVGYNYNRRDIVVLNVSNKALTLGPAERADVVVDFSGVPDGSSLILYNDAPAPMPAFDTRNDYYTGDPDQVMTGGAPTTLPGYGPNTRTILQFQVSSAHGTGPAMNRGALDAGIQAAFRETQPAPVVFEPAYDAAYGTSSPADPYARIQSMQTTFDTGFVTGLSVTNGGSGYTTPPRVVISGGGGTGATAIATLSGSGIGSLTLTDPGSGYTSAPVITISPPDAPGGGVQATASASISSTVAGVTMSSGGSGYTGVPDVAFTSVLGGTGVAGTANLTPTGVGTLQLTAPGANYSAPPTVSFSAPDQAGGTAPAAHTTLLPTSLSGIAVTNGGSGYTAPPTVTVTGGGGSGATATAVLSGGVVASITLVNGGVGYGSSPTVTLTGGGGSGATATATLTPTAVSAIQLTNAGTGYASAPTVSLTPVDGNGSGATAIATLTPTGVAAATVTSAGSGYSAPPAVSFSAPSAPGGAVPTAVASLLPTSVNALTLTDPGSLYISAPTVTFTGGGGSGASGATALAPTGVVGAINVTSPGTGYTTPPTVTIGTPFTRSAATAAVTAMTPTGVGSVRVTNGGTCRATTPAPTVTFVSVNGAGSGATGVAVVSQWLRRVTGVTITNPGSGYTMPPTVVFNGNGNCTGVAGTSALRPTSILSIGVTNPGSGYSSAPPVYIQGGGGTGARANAVIAKAVGSIMLTSGGSGYTSVPMVTLSAPQFAGGITATASAALAKTGVGSIQVITPGSGYTAPPSVALSGGGGSGAAATTTLVPTSVASVQLTNGGGGYTAAPTVAIDGGGGSGVAATASISTSVAGFTVTNGGSGYTSAPDVGISGGGGSGAAGAAVLGGAAVASVTLVTAGSGYTSAPSVAFSPVDGNGSGAAATASLAPSGVASITLDTNGSGYTAAPSVTLSAVTGDTTGAGATATATLQPTSVAGVTLTNPGTGYGAAPTVAFTGGGGSGAAATASLMPTGISGITVTNAGSGYSNPTVTIAPPDTPGTQATATAAITPTVVSGFTITNAGSGYVFPPTVTFVGDGSGATATAAISAPTPVTVSFRPMGIQELFDYDYGRMNATMSVEIPNTNGTNQTTIPYGYIDPPTDLVDTNSYDALPAGATPLATLPDGTQIWRFTHNGVDTHAIHFHMFNIQVINRVGWDGAIRPPDPNEIGWKDTVRMNPLEDAIVAIKPFVPTLPWPVPNSIRPLDVTSPLGTSGPQYTNVDPNGNPVTVRNHLVNLGWEYVYHCHLLGHEENDMMRPMAFGVAPDAPSVVTASLGGGGVTVSFTDNSVNETGFTIQRSADGGTTWTKVGARNRPAPTMDPGTQAVTDYGATTGSVLTFTDSTGASGSTYVYRVIASDVIGDTGTPGYPSVSVDSIPSVPSGSVTIP